MRKTILILGHSYSTQFIDINNQYSQLFAQDKYEVTVAYLTGQADESIRKRHCAEHVLFLNFSKKSIRGRPSISYIAYAKKKNLLSLYAIVINLLISCCG
jgi:hypothetical protein